jgi:uncharacterized protein YggE
MRLKMMIILLFATVTTFAQETFKGEHFIEVSGVATLEIDADELYLFIRLREFEENKTKVSLEKLDQDFMNALKNAGIDKKNLTISSAGSALSRLGKKGKDAFREKSYELKLSTAAQLETFLEKLEPVKVDQVMLTRVSHSNIEKLKLDLKVKALQAAQAKAQALLQGIGSNVGKALMVREWEQEYQPMAGVGNVMLKSAGPEMLDMGAQSGGEQTEFKKLKLRAQITAQFEIK